MRRLYTIVIFFFSGLIAFSQTYNPAVENIIDEVNLDSLIYYLRNLSGEDPVLVNGDSTFIEHRVSNWGNDLAADYLKETLEGLGLDTYEQEYSNGGRNVYAIQEGSIYPDEYYMICAHYDAVDYYCADDNGSGSAAVLEAARLFSNYQFEYSIIFALWDEEEIGLIGSDYYATQAASNGDVIHAVINMDMISWDGDNDMAVEIHASMEASSDALADYIVEVKEIYEIPLNSVIELPGTIYSDHSKFWDNDYAAVLIIEEYYGGDFNPYYHTEEDRIAILNMPYFLEMSKLSLGSLASLASPALGTYVDELNQVVSIQMKNYPNPFSYETTISYFLQEENYIRISLVNNQGIVVRNIEEGVKQNGQHQLKLQADNLPEGLYFLRTQIAKETLTHKILIN